jgi:hypothetical protein
MLSLHDSKRQNTCAERDSESESESRMHKWYNGDAPAMRPRASKNREIVAEAIILADCIVTTRHVGRSVPARVRARDSFRSFITLHSVLHGVPTCCAARTQRRA